MERNPAKSKAAALGRISAFVHALGVHPFWPYLRTHKRMYLLGLLSLVGVDIINVALPLVIRQAIDVLPTRDLSRVALAGGAFLALMLLQSLGRYLWRMYLIGTSHRIARDVRYRLYGHFQRLPLQFYQQIRTGDLMSRATNDVESIRMALGPGVLIAADAVLMFGMIVPVMFFLSAKLTLLAFAFYPVVPWLTARLGKKIDALFELLQERMSAISSHTHESFSAIRLIKGLVLENTVEKRFNDLSRQYEQMGIQLSSYQAAFSPALSVLTQLGTFLILLYGGKDVLEGTLTLGTFIAFQRFVVQLSWPMEAIGWAVTMSKEGIAAQRRLDDVLSEGQVQDVLRESPVVGGTPALFSIQNLEYRYPSPTGDRKMFGLHIAGAELFQGQRVGIVGPIGSGKTTLFNLMLRLHEPPMGTLWLKGQDITSIPLRELRRRLAYVEQQVYLFSQSIQENLFLGSQNARNPSLARKVTATASIDQEIEDLPAKYDTLLGERGVNLSGGQKQRIALARALTRDSDLLLLDDCFSAVDMHIEHAIIDRLFKDYPDLTLCVASHRLSIMPRMDEIWLLQEGKLVDRGSHTALLQRSSLYRGLWEQSERESQLESLQLTDLVS